MAPFRATRGSPEWRAFAFFVSERGARVHYHVLARTFVQLARGLGLHWPVGTPGVNLHKLRHSFAVGRLALNRHALSKEFCRGICWYKADGGYKDRRQAERHGGGLAGGERNETLRDRIPT